MILTTDNGIVVNSGTMTVDEKYIYCGDFAYPNDGSYHVYDVILPEEMSIQKCTYRNGDFIAIPEPEPVGNETAANDNE